LKSSARFKKRKNERSRARWRKKRRERRLLERLGLIPDQAAIDPARRALESETLAGRGTAW
jgi:hypothetical protein